MVPVALVVPLGWVSRKPADPAAAVPVVQVPEAAVVQKRVRQGRSMA